MKVVEIRDGFGLDHLALAERPRPEPGAGQVLVQIAAASLNYRDLMMIRGEYNPRQALPLIPCSDGVGKIVGVGEGVDRLQVGDRVATLFAQGWLAGDPAPELTARTLGGPVDGTLAEWMLLPEAGLVPVPAHLTDEEAATLPCSALTAWSALVTHGHVGAGDVVLVQGTGGVSIFAMQFAGLLGARVIVTSSRDEKLARARELGAWQTINYVTQPDWGKEARKLTGGRGVDAVIEVGGGATLAQSLACVRPGGQISVIGVLGGSTLEFSVIPLLMRNVKLQGIFVGHRLGFEAMNRAIEAHAMRPAVDRTFPLAESRTAFEHMAAGRHFGKICIRME